jgi:Coiled-coil domain-containing protein 55 (DUF2040)
MRVCIFAPDVSDACWRWFLLLVSRVQKEQAAEDHLFGDKEKFVTAAYKRKLEEQQKWLADQKLK